MAKTEERETHASLRASRSRTRPDGLGRKQVLIVVAIQTARPPADENDELRLETESEARRTLIELTLQNNSSSNSTGGGGGDPSNANAGSAASASCSTCGSSSSEGASGSAPERRDVPGGAVAAAAAAAGASMGSVRRGVTPEKGASLWAGVGIGAMLQVSKGNEWWLWGTPAVARTSES